MSEMRAEPREAPFRLPASPGRSDLVAKYFRGLGDQTRVRILELLRDEGELTVGELVERLELPQPKVSNHLACLRWCGFVEARREHRTVYNRIRDAVTDAINTERDGIERVLEAAAIPRSRCGPERTARLSREERQLYHWILQRFAHAAPPTPTRLAEQARAFDLEPSAAFATLA